MLWGVMWSVNRSSVQFLEVVIKWQTSFQISALGSVVDLYFIVFFRCLAMAYIVRYNFLSFRKEICNYG
jgi:hypothetical protein